MRKFSVFTQANLYTIVAILYTIRRYLLPNGMPSRIVFILFFLISGYYFFKVIGEYLSLPMIKALTFLVFLFSIYGFFLVLAPPDLTWLRICGSFQFLNDFLDSLLPIFAFFYFSKKNLINANWIIVWTLVFVVAALFQYNGMLTQSLMALAEGAEEITNNGGYVIMSVIPCLVFFQKHRIIQYALWALIMMVVIFSVKRGAIILSTIALLVFLWQRIKRGNPRNKLLLFLLSVLLIFVVYRFIQNLLETTDLFRYRLFLTLEGDSSRRDLIYTNYFYFFINESNPLFLLLGHGAYGTLHYLGLMAHNDWLEIAIDMGVLGLSVYFYYWVKVFGMTKHAKNSCMEEVYLSLLLFSLLYFGKTLVSMSIMAIPIYAAVPFGYCIAQYYNAIQDDNHENP